MSSSCTQVGDDPDPHRSSRSANRSGARRKTAELITIELRRQLAEVSQLMNPARPAELNVHVRHQGPELTMGRLAGTSLCPAHVAEHQRQPLAAALGQSSPPIRRKGGRKDGR
jgi:hypothetical protein